jgi:exonuclease VII small subunit
MKESIRKAIIIYKEGKSIMKSAAETGASFQGLQYQLRKLGLTRSAKEAANKSYTKESLEEALNLYENGKSLNEVNKLTKVSKHTLRKEIKKLKIIKKKIIKHDPLLEKSIDLYQSGLSSIKVIEITGIGIGKLTDNLKKRGLTRSNKINSRRYDVDHEFFNKIDNEHKAYWLGFIYADGYVSKRKETEKKLGIALGIKDINHLETFKKHINATYPINIYKSKSFGGVEIEYCRLLMSSDQLFDDLVAKGVFEKKTLILKFPDESIVPKQLQNHFIRGYFDGDGSFKKSNDGFYVFNLCGTKEFLLKCQEILGKQTKLEKRHKDDKNNYSFSIGGRRQVKKIGDYLYQNATVYLERKYTRYKKTCF